LLSQRKLWQQKKTQTDCILFCAPRRTKELRPKALSHVRPRSENFGIYNNSNSSNLFCPAAQRKSFGICQREQIKLNALRSAALGKFLVLQQKQCILFSRAAKLSELRPKALHFVQPRSKKLWNCEQKHCIVFSRTPKNYELRTKAFLFVQPRSENFGIVTNRFWSERKLLELRPKALHSVQPRSEIFLNCEQKHCILFSRAAKMEFTNKHNSN
jgi:hypothetical protein